MEIKACEMTPQRALYGERRFSFTRSEAATSVSGHRKAATSALLHFTSRPIKKEHLPLDFTTRPLIQHCFLDLECFKMSAG